MLINDIVQTVLSTSDSTKIELYQYPNNSYQLESYILGFLFVLWLIAALICLYKSANSDNFGWVLFMFTNTVVSLFMGYYMNNEENTINNSLIQLKGLEQKLQILLISKNLLYTPISLPLSDSTSLVILSIIQISITALCTTLYLFQILEHLDTFTTNIAFYLTAFVPSLIGVYLFYKHQKDSRILRDSVSTYISKIYNRYLILSNNI